MFHFDTNGALAAQRILPFKGSATLTFSFDQPRQIKPESREKMASTLSSAGGVQWMLCVARVCLDGSPRPGAPRRSLQDPQGLSQNESHCR
jgi:hypothetical protein